MRFCQFLNRQPPQMSPGDPTERYFPLFSSFQLVPVSCRDGAALFIPVPVSCRDGIVSFPQVLLWLMPVPVSYWDVPVRYREVPVEYRDALTELHRELGLW